MNRNRTCESREADLIHRRSFLVCAAAAAAAPSLALAGAAREGSNLDAIVGNVPPRLDMICQRSGDVLDVRFFADGRYDRAALERINVFMRDWRENETKQMSVRTLWALAALRAASIKSGYGGRLVYLSGYRTERTNAKLREQGAARNSKHIDAEAVDFTMSDAPLKKLRDFSRWLGVGGVGYYPRQSFIHVDSGPERAWGPA
ncbi:MAG: hypothetical protein DI629_17580 [Mesorhizobium amorphae]|nr:MAG: hypothetical protein DI629_17580 [Mesorhizobium amorphae]